MPTTKNQYTISVLVWRGCSKNAAKQVASDVGGKTLEMTRLGIYLEEIDASYPAWQAASVILEKYTDELLFQCEVFVSDSSRKGDFRKMVELFKLKTPMNRSLLVQKTYDQIQNDYDRWLKVSEAASKI